MATLTETITSALQAVGRATAAHLREVVAEFDDINLSGEERLAAIATALGALAWNHHRRHRHVYLDAVKTWALEIAGELQPDPLRLRAPADQDRIAESAEVLIAGVDALIEMMSAGAVRMQDRLVTELAIVARLLGEHDANTIHLVMRSVAEALDRTEFDPGEVIVVPLREAALPISRDAALETLAPRGCA